MSHNASRAALLGAKSRRRPTMHGGPRCCPMGCKGGETPQPGRGTSKGAIKYATFLRRCQGRAGARAVHVTWAYVIRVWKYDLWLISLQSDSDKCLDRIFLLIQQSIFFL